MAVKVAIIGFSSSHEEAPWQDPTWEKWGMANDPYWAQMSRLFEMHELEDLEERNGGLPPNYIDDRLKGAWVPLYMQRKYFEHVIPFPVEIEEYYASSVAYIMALAVHEGAEEIGLWGIDMAADTEYHEQKPNMEYFIGKARGKGITVYIHPSSSLCKFQCSNPKYSTRYGWSS